MANAKAKKVQDFPPLDEVLDVIRNSALTTPLMFVEGPDDVVIYREIGIRAESPLMPTPCGGRKAVFELHEAVHQAGLQHKRPLLFFADRDTYVFSGIPALYAGIHFTSGYSIENDLFADGQTRLERDMRPAEWERFTTVVANLVRWFAFEVEILEQARETEPGKDSDFKDIDIHRPHTLDWSSLMLHQEFLDRRGFSDPSQAWHQPIADQPFVCLRGKFLMELYRAILRTRPADSGGTALDPSDKSVWNTCIGEGLAVEGSHVRRIAAVMQAA